MQAADVQITSKKLDAHTPVLKHNFRNDQTHAIRFVMIFPPKPKGSESPNVRAVLKSLVQSKQQAHQVELNNV